MPKRRTKQQRDEAERKRKARRDAKRAAELASVMAALGVLNEFRKQPLPLRKHFSRLRYPRPEVVLDEITEKLPEAPAIANDFSTILEEECITLHTAGRTVRIIDFLCIGISLWHQLGLKNLGTTAIEEANQFLNCMYTATNDHIPGNLDRALEMLVGRMEYSLLKYSRIDGKLFWTSLDFPSEEDGDPKYMFRIIVHGCRAQEQRRQIEGVPKRLYRCGASFEEGIDWVSWTPAELGLAGPKDALPVFIDGGHALRNLRERVTVAQNDGVVDRCIWLSLQSPKVERREGDRFLVAYHLLDQKLGYFVFKAFEDMYLAKTFLFLTMDGTPEGQKLWEKLRLTKKDKQYTGLDRLSTFVLSDIKEDSELAAVFEQCGCAHLFNVAEELLTDRQLRGSAEDVRKYLGNRLDRAVQEIRQRPARVFEE